MNPLFFLLRLLFLSFLSSFSYDDWRQLIDDDRGTFIFYSFWNHHLQSSCLSTYATEIDPLAIKDRPLWKLIGKREKGIQSYSNWYRAKKSNRKKEIAFTSWFRLINVGRLVRDLAVAITHNRHRLKRLDCLIFFLCGNKREQKTISWLTSGIFCFEESVTTISVDTFVDIWYDKSTTGWS